MTKRELQEESADPHGDHGAHARGARPDFVAFRRRLTRLIESLVALRDVSSSEPWGELEERVEMRLEGDAVTIELFVAQLSCEVVTELAHHFRRTFMNFAPAFLETSPGSVTLRQSREKDGSYGLLRTRDDTTLTVQRWYLRGEYRVTLETRVSQLEDHFEVFATDAARILFPPIAKPSKKTVADVESWYEEYERPFERLGCRVHRDSHLSWTDLAGLAHLRERLEQSIFRPLAREGLYRKVARRVMPGRVHLLPQGVLLHGPPGCGKTWSLRVIAGEAGVPVVVLPCQGVLTMWYGESEKRLAGVFRLCREAGRMILLIDELDALARHRGESSETTARLVSILLAELDGLADSSDVLVVASVNEVASLDRAVLDRFDLKIEFDPPDPSQREAALAYYARQLSADEVAAVAAHLDGWNFRQIARFAEEVVRTYVSGLDVTRLEAGEPPLPRKEDYLKTLEVCRSMAN